MYGLEYRSDDACPPLEGEAHKRDRFLMLSSSVLLKRTDWRTWCSRPGVVRREVLLICGSNRLLSLRAARSPASAWAIQMKKTSIFLLCLSREIQF